MKKTKCLFDDNKHTPAGMVSVSQLQSFMSCPKKWEYGYVNNLTPRVERPYLSIGKLCHKGMQVAMQYRWAWQHSMKYSNAEALAKATKAMRDEWREYMDNTPFLDEEIATQEEVLSDALSVFTQAFEEFQPWKYEVLTVRKDNEEIPALELHFVVPCAGSKGLHGYIDAILLDKETGFVWCTDYKFRKSLSPDDEEATNVQNAVYTHACNKMGIDITGTMTWQHVNTPASRPQVLKNGAVSRAKIKTTWSEYKRFCEEIGVDPAPYEEEMKEKLSDIEWFRPTYEYRSDEFVKSVWDKVIVPASKSVKSAYGKSEKDGNMKHMYPWNCKMCQYLSLCQAELRGYDTESIALREYTTRSARGR